MAACVRECVCACVSEWQRFICTEECVTCCFSYGHEAYTNHTATRMSVSLSGGEGGRGVHAGR